MLIVLLVGSLALQVRAWKRLTARVRFTKLTKLRAIGRYGFWAFAPLLLVVAVFFTEVGLEEWFGIAPLSESTARAMPIVAGLLLATALIGWVSFALRCIFIEQDPASDPRGVS